MIKLRVCGVRRSTGFELEQYSASVPEVDESTIQLPSLLLVV